MILKSKGVLLPSFVAITLLVSVSLFFGVTPLGSILIGIAVPVFAFLCASLVALGRLVLRELELLQSARRLGISVRTLEDEYRMTSGSSTVKESGPSFLGSSAIVVNVGNGIPPNTPKPFLSASSDCLVVPASWTATSGPGPHCAFASDSESTGTAVKSTLNIADERLANYNLIGGPFDGHREIGVFRELRFEAGTGFHRYIKPEGRAAYYYEGFIDYPDQEETLT